MLSRVAHSLFWIGRYFERVENITRIIQDSLFSLIEIEHLDEVKEFQHWKPILRACSAMKIFEDQKIPHNTKNILDFLIFNKNNSSAICNCISNIRQNAHMVRDQISEEMWAWINRLYHQTQDVKIDCGSENIQDFLTIIRDESIRFQGLVSSTLARDEGYYFIQFGKFLERSYHTLNIIDLKYHLILPRGSKDVGSSIDVAQWIVILKSLSAQDAYRKKFVNEINPEGIISLLVLDKKFPRSIRFCFEQVFQTLDLIGLDNNRSNTPYELFDQILLKLKTSSASIIIKNGLHETLTKLKNRIYEIDQEIFNTYLFLPEIDKQEEIRQQQRQQQQQQTFYNIVKL